MLDSDVTHEECPLGPIQEPESHFDAVEPVLMAELAFAASVRNDMRAPEEAGCSGALTSLDTALEIVLNPCSSGKQWRHSGGMVAHRPFSAGRAHGRDVPNTRESIVLSDSARICELNCTRGFQPQNPSGIGTSNVWFVPVIAAMKRGTRSKHRAFFMLPSSIVVAQKNSPKHVHGCGLAKFQA